MLKSDKVKMIKDILREEGKEDKKITQLISKVYHPFYVDEVPVSESYFLSICDSIKPTGNYSQKRNNTIDVKIVKSFPAFAIKKEDFKNNH